MAAGCSELGALPDENALDDVLARQSERMPTASVAYVLGYADERSLAGVLAVQSCKNCSGTRYLWFTEWPG